MERWIIQTACETSDEGKDSVRNWATGLSYYILPKDLSSFCPSSETLSEDKLKYDGVVNLTEEILRQHKTQVAAQLLLTVQ
jgi:hypothetical protein